MSTFKTEKAPPRCRYCGWVLAPGERAPTIPGICRHCEKAIKEAS